MNEEDENHPRQKKIKIDDITNHIKHHQATNTQ